MRDTTKEAALHEIREAAKVAERYAYGVQTSVNVARERGATWEEVGAVLGITKQAAQQRFASARD